MPITNPRPRPPPPVELVAMQEPNLSSTMATDVRRGLSHRPRSIPPKYFYDARGSELFDRICALPEYYLTRAERALLERHAESIVEDSGAVELVELGSGMARKTGLLLGAMARRSRAPRYVPIDIEKQALEASARALVDEHPSVVVRGIVGDFQHDLHAIPRETKPRIIAFLGSTIGNLDQDAAPALIRAVAARMSPRDTFLLGADLVKDVEVLERAYDDAEGVTALFNLNVLSVINRALDADFDLASFRHRARYDVGQARIEMHLESERAQRVHIAALDLELAFDRGERILTEISRKFTRETIEATLREGGLRLDRFLADDGLFALAVARLA